MIELDARAIATGAAVALAIGVPAGLLAQTLDEVASIDDNTSWLVALTLVILVGMAAGGYVAASRRADAPLSHAAAAALAAFIVVQAVGMIGRVADGEAIEWFAVPIVGVLAAAAGIVGGLVADWHARTPSR